MYEGGRKNVFFAKLPKDRYVGVRSFVLSKTPFAWIIHRRGSISCSSDRIASTTMVMDTPRECMVLGGINLTPSSALG